MRGLLNFIKMILKLTVILTVLGLLLYGFYTGMDFIFRGILSKQATSVLSNFVVFSAIIIFVMTRIVNTSSLLETAQKSVVDEIYASENVKVESETKLSNVEESMAHIEEEIESILSKSEQNAKLVGEKILIDADKSIQILQDNTAKSIENSQVLLKNDLIKRVSLASVEVAKKQILQELNNNQGLHDRLIDESLESIDIMDSNLNEEIA